MKKNTSGYSFHPSTPVHKNVGYHPGKEGLLIFGEVEQQGIQAFGPQGGVITEDDLTPTIVEFLMNKEDGNGNKLYAKYFVKDKAEGKADAGKEPVKEPVVKTPATKAPVKDIKTKAPAKDAAKKYDEAVDFL